MPAKTIETLLPLRGLTMSSHQVGVAAEAYAAGIFARVGCHVSVQYGANQPRYDLIVERDDKPHLLSVKGSKDGGWVLASKGLKKGQANFQEAINIWERAHSNAIIFCFVQFQNCALNQMPAIYLARPLEIASFLRASRGGKGRVGLAVSSRWKDAEGNSKPSRCLQSGFFLTKGCLSFLIGCRRSSHY